MEGLHSCHIVREFCINEIGKYRCEAVIITDNINVDGNQYEREPQASWSLHECPNGFVFDPISRQCLGKYSLYIRKNIKFFCFT